jgi:hypothetical protein
MRSASRSGLSLRRLAFATPLALLSLLCCCIGIAPRSSWAQEETRGALPERRLEEEAAVGQAAEQAAQEEARRRQAVTYSQILADPDNLELNLRYAEAQLESGELAGASATLERILLLQPEHVEARLLRAAVLLRLGSVEEARTELAALQQLPLAPELRRHVEARLREASRLRRRTKLSATLTSGMQFDTNRNSAPSPKTQLFLDIPLGLEGTARRRHDTSWVNIHRLDIAHDLGTQAGHELLGAVTYYLGEQTTVDDLDLEAFGAEGGARLKTPAGTLTPRITAQHIRLSRETYQRIQSAETRWDRALSPRIRAFLEGRWTREDYSGITESSAAHERRGDRVGGGGGLQIAVTPSMMLFASLSQSRKTAKAAYYTYDATELQGTHILILPREQFLINALTFQLDAYSDPDAAISARTRRDRQLRYRITYGIPLALLSAGLLPEGITDRCHLSLAVEQFRSLSNITNYTYRNRAFSALVTKQLEF